MRSKQLKLHTLLFIGLLGLASVPAFAGSAVIGSVAGSMNSTVAGQAVLPNSVVFSGDTLKVSDGATVIAMNGGSRLVFGRETEASFLRDGGNVTVMLGQGNVSVFDPDSSAGLQVKANDLSIVPTKGFKTLGEVAMSNGAVTVAVKEGSLRVEGNGAPVEVTKGQVITIHPKTARSPQAGGAQSMGGGNTDNLLDIAGIAAGGIAAILAGIAMSRAGDAKTNAQAAIAAANAANSSAQAATAAANQADADAKASQQTANSVGCALNNFNNNTFGVPSPYTPPSGSTC